MKEKKKLIDCINSIENIEFIVFLYNFIILTRKR